MKSIICKHTKETKCGEVTQLYVFGIPVFRSVYVGTEDKPHTHLTHRLTKNKIQTKMMNNS